MSDSKENFLLARKKLREEGVIGLTNLGVSQDEAEAIVGIFSTLRATNASRNHLSKRTLERFIENANIFCGIQENSGCLPANFFTKLAELYNIVKDDYPQITNSIAYFLYNSQNFSLEESFIFPGGEEDKQKCLRLMMQIMEDNMKKHGQIEHKIILVIINGLACYNIRVPNEKILEMVTEELKYFSNRNETSGIIRRFACFALRVFPNREMVDKLVGIRDLNKFYNLFVTDVDLPWYSKDRSRSYPNQFFMDSLKGLGYSSEEISEIVKEIPAYKQQLKTNPSSQGAGQFSPGSSISPIAQASGHKMPLPASFPISQPPSSSSFVPMGNSNLLPYPPTSVLPSIFPSSFIYSYPPMTPLYSTLPS
jgi:hypothetical protein